MSNTNVFGPIVAGPHVELAVVESMKLWMDEYLYEIERDPVLGYHPGQIERPRGIVTSSQFEKWPEDQLPVILVLCAGLAGPPSLRAPDGTYDAVWRVGIATVVSDTDQISTRLLSGAYAAAVRLALLQHAMLKSDLYPAGFSHFIDWEGEDYTDVPFQESRTMMAGQIILNVGVENVARKQAGPRTPSNTPSTDPGDWPVSDLSDPTVEPRTLTESLT